MAISFKKGEKYNHLTIADDCFAYVKEDKGGNKRRYWRCICDCGNETFVAASFIKNGHTKTCGCSQHEPAITRIDETGKRYNKLTVIKYAYTKNNKCYWKCVCDCGNETIVWGTHLRNGNTKSCGVCSKQSIGEINIESLLIDSNIPFAREIRFLDCKDKKPLPFDFGIYNENNELLYLIECQGQQHYEETGWKNFNYVKKHNRIKAEWCKKNNIPLLYIPYIKYNNLTIEDLKIKGE